jgi:hypothetical protein
VNPKQKPLLLTIGLTVAIVVIVVLLFVLKNKPFEFIYQTF